MSLAMRWAAQRVAVAWCLGTRPLLVLTQVHYTHADGPCQFKQKGRRYAQLALDAVERDTQRE